MLRLEDWVVVGPDVLEELKILTKILAGKRLVHINSVVGGSGWPKY
jgi:hypothetical protein